MKSKLLALLLLTGTSLVAQRFSFGVSIGGGHRGGYGYGGYSRPYGGYSYGPVYSSGYGYGPSYAYGSGYYPAPPPPPPPAYAYAPPYPGPGYTFINGHWGFVGGRYNWRPGYWARPPYAGARWVAPRYYGRNYYNGYWRR